MSYPYQVLDIPSPWSDNDLHLVSFTIIRKPSFWRSSPRLTFSSLRRDVNNLRQMTLGPRTKCLKSCWNVQTCLVRLSRGTGTRPAQRASHAIETCLCELLRGVVRACLMGRRAAEITDCLVLTLCQMVCTRNFSTSQAKPQSLSSPIDKRREVPDSATGRGQVQPLGRFNCYTF